MLNGELPKQMVDTYYSVAHDMLPAEKADEMVNGMLQRAKEMMRPTLKQMYGQAQVVGSEYVGDEFHFRMSIPMPELPEVPGMEVPEIPDSMTPLRKIRKENGVWRIYDSQR